MIQGLIDKDYAYEAEAHVLFNVKSFKKYGVLSNRNLKEMVAGARVEVAPYKKNSHDFVCRLILFLLTIKLWSLPSL